MQFSWNAQKLTRQILSKPMAIGLIFVLLVTFFVPLGADSLGNNLRINQSWSEGARKERGGRDAQKLFRKAVEKGIIKYDLSQDQFSVTTLREFNHNPNINNQSIDLGGYSKATIIGLLWKGRGSGDDIRKQLQAHNLGVFTTAIRDNTGLLRECLNDDDNGKCNENLWVAQIGVPQQTNQGNVFTSGFSSDVSQLTINSPSIGVFGPLALQQIPNFRKWYSLGGSEVSGAQINFIRPISEHPDNNTNLIIDVIGSEIFLPAEAKTGSGLELTRYCPPKLDGENKLSINIERCSENDKAIAFRVKLPARFADNELAIRVKPVRSYNIPEVERTAVFQPQETILPATATKVKTYSLTNNVRLRCYSDSSDQRRCLLNWLTATSQKKLMTEEAVQKLGIADALSLDGSEIGESKASTSLVNVNEDGELSLSKRGIGMGLVSVFGTSSEDQNSLLDLIANPPETMDATDISITVNEELQEIVSRRFSDLLVNKTGISPELAGGVSSRYDHSRRAGIVLLDVSDPAKQGAIVAATGYPFYDGTLSPWDLLAIRTLDPTRDPLAPHAWGAIDGRYTPGSVFKLVSALNLIDITSGYIEDVETSTQQEVFGALTGSDRETFRSVFNVDLRQPSAKITRTNSTRDGTFLVGDASEKAPMIQAYNLPAGTCGRRQSNKAENPQRVRVYGLCEALAQSSNIWFSKVVEYANAKRIENFWSRDPLKEKRPFLADTLSRLNLDKSYPLILTNNEDTLAVPASLSADAILADSIDTARLADPTGRLYNLEIGLSGYGQTVKTSPLSIATISAAIATGNIVSPFLVSEKDATPVITELYSGNPEAIKLLETLRVGMNAVVNKSSGTAYGQFRSEDKRSFAKRVFGKTGTPTLAGFNIPSDANVEGAWFTGWIGDSSSPRSPKPKYAFGCGISHVVSGGSQICAALMAEILSEIEEKGL